MFIKIEEDHRQHLQETFIRLRVARLTANTEKYEFGKTSIEFLGHTVFANSIAPLPSRVVAISAHLRPNTIKELQNFLGVINFYWKFVLWAAAMLRPLTDALQGSPRPKLAVEWRAKRQTAFKAAKAALWKATNLASPRLGADLGLMVDASADHVGAAL